VVAFDARAERTGCGSSALRIRGGGGSGLPSEWIGTTPPLGQALPAFDRRVRFRNRVVAADGKERWGHNDPRNGNLGYGNSPRATRAGGEVAAIPD
jgi:hypothetical protein